MDNNTERLNLYDANESVSPETYSFGMATLRRLWAILKIFFSEHLCTIFIILICLLALLEQYLVYNVGIIPSAFYKVLGDKDLNAFWLQILKATLLILAICFVISCKNYVINVFYVTSREALTNTLHVLYFNSNKFYILNTFKYDFTDNPDQRITQDIDKFCHEFSSIIGPFVIAPFTISYYSYNCFQTTGWIGPVGIFLVFILSAVINKLLMKPIVTKVVQQEKCEGNFRFKHMHVRTNAESIAFQDANIAELSRSDNKLVALIKIQQSLYLRQFPLNVAVKVFSYFGSIISYLILAYPIFSGTYDDLTPPELSALISKNAFVSIYLISCFSSLIDLSSQISEIGGLTHRVFEILDILNLNYEEDISDCSSKSSKFKMKSGEFYQEAGDSQVPVIELNNVTFCAPRETKPLISDISLEIFIGKNLLITGKSSSGKTSLFRIIKGLWPIDEGTITRRLPFQPSSVFFLPQRSLLSDGTLLEQIVYPLELPRFLKPHHEDIDLILSYLHFAELDHVLKKAGLDDDVDWNWYDVLSPGEAQRLSFVRLFYHRPKLAFLDEATSALGLDLETKLYKKCTELGITLVSIGHRTSLVQFHSDILHLDGEGGWTLTPVDEIN